MTRRSARALRIAASLGTGLAVFAAAWAALERGRTPLLRIALRAEQVDHFQVFLDRGEGFLAEGSTWFTVGPVVRSYAVAVPRGTTAVRIDPGTRPGRFAIESIEAWQHVRLRRWDAERGFGPWRPLHDLSRFTVEVEGLVLEASGEDPQFANAAWRRVERRRAGANALLALLPALATGALARLATRRIGAGEAVAAERGRARRHALGFRIALVALASGVGALGSWALYRAFAPRPSAFFEGESADYRPSIVNRIGESLSGERGELKLMLDPATLYRNFPNRETNSYTIDARGFRAGPPEAGDPEANGAIAVVVGGSVAFGQPLSDDRATFAALLNRYAPGYVTLNAGVVGYLSGQELALMVHYLDELRPAVYVVVDGWNDLFDPYFAGRGCTGPLGFNSAFSVLEQRLSAPGPAGLDHAPLAPSERESCLRRVGDRYLANLDKMDAFARARGARLLVVFQPDLGNKQTPSEAEREILDRWNRSHEYEHSDFPDTYRKLVRRAGEFCASRGIEYVDLNGEPSFAGSPETLFSDAAHINERGHEILARIIGRRLNAWSAVE